MTKREIICAIFLMPALILLCSDRLWACTIGVALLAPIAVILNLPDKKKKPCSGATEQGGEENLHI